MSAGAPRVSVVLPVRDGGAFLRLAVESLLAQTFADYEILLIDDGSRDGAVAALAGIDSRLRVLSSPGAGLVAALNFGIENAKAGLVARMDADDVSLPQRLARQVAFLDAARDVAVVGTQVEFIGARGALTGERTHFPCEPEAIAEALTRRGCVIKHPTVLARKTALIDVGGYRPALEKAEDYDLWLRLAERARLANLPDVLLHYRVHPGQASAGVNLAQRFAHDLALISMRARRAGAPDPLANFTAPLDFGALPPDAPPPIGALGDAYSALAYFENRSVAPPTPRALAELAAMAQQGLLGDGRRFRALSLARAARFAARLGLWPLAARAARLALRTAPGRAPAWLLRGG